MHWSQTESSKCSLNCLLSNLSHPFTVKYFLHRCVFRDLTTDWSSFCFLNYRALSIINSQKYISFGTRQHAAKHGSSPPQAAFAFLRHRVELSLARVFRPPCRLNNLRWIAAVAGWPPERPRARRRRRPEHYLQRRWRNSSAEAGTPRGPGGSFFPCCLAKGDPFAEARPVACAAREIGAVSAG